MQVIIDEEQMKTTHPWQITPTELIKKAIEFLDRDTEHDRQIAFLLLDVGIETLFKTFLLLSDSVTGVVTKFSKRKNATLSSFHDLIQTTKEAGKDRLSGIDLDKVKYYHDIRNKLYHQGDGVIPTTVNTYDYAAIAVELLYRLLSVDLRPLLQKEQQEKELIEKRKALFAQKMVPVKKELRDLARQIHTNLIRQLEEEESEFVKKSFADDMEEYINNMSQPEGRRWRSGVRRFIYEGLFILDDDDMPVKCMMWDTSDDMVDFLLTTVKESPFGPPPKLVVDFLLNHLYWAEWEIAELITSGDFTEFLIRLTDHGGRFEQMVSVDDYLEIKSILDWDFESILADEEFENKLNDILERGQQILSKTASLSA